MRRRADGYHEICSIFQEIPLADIVEVEIGGGAFSVEYVGADGEITPGEDSISVAYALLKEALGAEFGVKVRVYKKIPVGAGLGGGSADAGAFLRAVAEAINLDMGKVEEVAKSVGADVPFFLRGKTALVKGKGEKVIPLPPLPGWCFLLVVPPYRAKTSWAYKVLSPRLDFSPGTRTEELARRIIAKTVGIFDFATLATNSFERVLRERFDRRGFSRILDALREKFEFCGITGSGTGVFALSEEPVEREKWEKTFKDCRVFAGRLGDP